MSSIVVAGDTSGSVTLQAPAVAGSSVLTLPAVSGTVLSTGNIGVIDSGMLSSTAQYTGFKNRIINGGMVIDQRNAGASVPVTNATLTYAVDRTLVYEDTSASSCTAQRVTDAPAGFINSLKFTVGTGGSATAAQTAVIDQSIEGFNFADFSFGTASAQTATISFWVKASITGTYCVAFRNASDARSYVAQYTVSAANTWEQKTITIAGDTTGTWATDNGRGITVRWDLGSGSTSQTATIGSWQAGLKYSTSSQANVIGTSGATFYITGVQLEKGSVATSFDQRAYSQELAMCQRYYQAFSGLVIAVPYIVTSTLARQAMLFPVQMRSSPTVTVTAQTYTNTSTLTVVSQSVGHVAFGWLTTANGGDVSLISFNASIEL